MSTSETDVNRNFEAERRTYAEEAEREPYAIERDIDATRADMRATIEALERRFSFDRLLDLTIGRIRERGGEFAGNLTNAATDNPMPLLLTTIGIGWMMLASRGGPRERSYAHDSTANESSPGVRQRMAEAANTVRGAAEATSDTLRSGTDTLRRGSDTLRSGATRVAAATREHVDDARVRMERLLDEQPLVLGALGLVAGAIMGALLPASEQENRLLGEARASAIARVARTSRARRDASEQTRDPAREQTTSQSVAPGPGSTDDERPTSRPH
jgi:X-X-X-Leu-X-X-Gly heptad repeat protein